MLFRSIEISRAFEESDFTEFDRKRVPDVFYAGMMEYDGDAHIPKNYLVEPPAFDRTLGEYLCASGTTSFAISETQKFGHVTYFWNGNNTGYIDEKLEEYVEIPSDKIVFDLRPWMKAAEITDEVVNAIIEGDYKFIRLNFANGDMVGHTGVPEAVEIAVEDGSGYMSTILREPGPIYRVRYDKVPLEQVANSERHFPGDWISGDRIDVTDDFVRYARPLIGDNWPAIPLVNGRQRFARLEHIFAPQKLPAYVPQTHRGA